MLLLDFRSQLKLQWLKKQTEQSNNTFSETRSNNGVLFTQINFICFCKHPTNIHRTHVLLYNDMHAYSFLRLFAESKIHLTNVFKKSWTDEKHTHTQIHVVQWLTYGANELKTSLCYNFVERKRFKCNYKCFEVLTALFKRALKPEQIRTKNITYFQHTHSVKC